MFEDVFSLLVVAGWEMCGDDEHDTLCQGFDGESMHHIVTLAPYAEIPIFQFECDISDPVPIQKDELRIFSVFNQISNKMPIGAFCFEDVLGEIFASLKYGWYVPCVSNVEFIVNSIEEITAILVKFNDRCWQAVRVVAEDKTSDPVYVTRLSIAPSAGNA